MSDSFSTSQSIFIDKIDVKPAAQPDPHLPSFVSSEIHVSRPGKSADGPPRPFAKILPANEAAKNAFHELVVSESLEECHRDSMVVQNKDGTKERCHCHLTLSFEQCPPFLPTLGYHAGKGTTKFPKDRSVDIMMVSPEDEAAKEVASNHALIQIHPESVAPNQKVLTPIAFARVVILAAGSREKPLFYSLENVEIELLHPQKHVLYQASNRFRIGDFAYDFNYAIAPESLDDYVQQRNRVLAAIYGRRPPHPSISAIPMAHDRKLGVAIIYGSMNYGSFGLISAAVHRETAQPLAVKELWIKDKSSVKSITREVEVAWGFTKPQRDILRTVDIQCEHGGKMPSGKTPEKIYIFTSLAQRNFAEEQWGEIGFPTKLRLLEDTLRGYVGSMTLDTCIGT